MSNEGQCNVRQSKDHLGSAGLRTVEDYVIDASFGAVCLAIVTDVADTHSLDRQAVTKHHKRIQPPSSQCPSHLLPENSERGSGLTSLAQWALAFQVLTPTGLYFFFGFGIIDVSLTLQRQVWHSPEVWSVPGSLVLLIQSVSSLSDLLTFLPVVQRQEEFYLKLERQKQVA